MPASEATRYVRTYVRELATEVFGIPLKSDETILTTKNHLTQLHTIDQPELTKASALHRKHVCLLFLRKVPLRIPVKHISNLADLSFSTIYHICQVMF